MSSQHTFHIPVMGTGFTIDSPIRVARFGISSVISLVDDHLIEDVRRFYAQRYGEAYTPIKKNDADWRARRITEYLNLVDRIVKKQVENLKKAPFEAGSEIVKYFELLPDESALKKLYHKMLAAREPEKAALQAELREKVTPGRIDVNIMTKVDWPVFDKDGAPLPDEQTDAMAALRGYAKSTLNSAIVMSAGFNRKLYSYIEEFEDFFADAAGRFKKEIILKVSDYRSAITQGKFLAKKGLWVSEFRVESGLNCGGHAFSSAGELMGPILEELKQKKTELINQLKTIYEEALKLKSRVVPEILPPFRLTAQGGIGTANEDRFLKRYYGVVSTGWGSPFLLVPEAVQIDKETLDKLAAAGENDIYLSDVSPLNIAFNNLRNSLSEIKKCWRISQGEPGSPCYVGHLKNNTEFTRNPICTASRTYQKMKLETLKAMRLPKEEYERRAAKVTAKACICMELGDGVYKNENIQKPGGTNPAVCPGPNIAYFTHPVSLKEMVDHIYGRINIMPFKSRPHMFVKELRLNIEQFENLIKEQTGNTDPKKDEALLEFRGNLTNGIAYYHNLIPQISEEPQAVRKEMLHQLKECEQKISTLYPLAR